MAEAQEHIDAVLPADFSTFLRCANMSAPELFSFNKLPQDPVVKKLLSELQIVFSVWKKLVKMGSSSRKWSEADYAANVYVPLAYTIAWGTDSVVYIQVRCHS